MCDVGLASLRKKIDEIDSNICQLLINRMEIVGRVGQYKTMHNKTTNLPYMRPGREYEVLFTFVNALYPQYGYNSIFRIVRNLISQSLYNEQELGIIASNNDLIITAQEFFPDATSLKIAQDFDSQLNLYLENMYIGVVSHPNSASKWWMYNDVIAFAKHKNALLISKVPFDIRDNYKSAVPMKCMSLIKVQKSELHDALSQNQIQKYTIIDTFHNELLIETDSINMNTQDLVGRYYCAQ